MWKGLQKILSDHICGGGNFEINLFDFWHIGYILLFVATAIGLAFALKNKSEKTKHRVVNGFLIAALILYALDFFAIPLKEDNMGIDKLPFHLCTSVTVMAAFAQFNKRFSWLKAPAVMLCLVSSIMYITYPGTSLGGVDAMSYRVVQTFFFHGCVLIYGFLAIATGEVKLNIKNIWKDFLLILFVAAWASIGNAFYNRPDRFLDWFFLTGGTFPFIPKWLMPFVAITAVALMVLLMYGIYYIVLKIQSNHKLKKEKPIPVNNENKEEV